MKTKTFKSDLTIVQEADKAVITVKYKDDLELCDYFVNNLLPSTKQFELVQKALVSVYGVLSELFKIDTSADFELAPVEDKIQVTLSDLHGAENSPDTTLSVVNSFRAALSISTNEINWKDSSEFSFDKADLGDLRVSFYAYKNKGTKRLDDTFCIGVSKRIPIPAGCVQASTYNLIGTYDISTSKFFTVAGDPLSVPPLFLKWAKGKIDEELCKK